MIHDFDTYIKAYLQLARALCNTNLEGKHLIEKIKFNGWVVLHEI